jgi:hypothetical protein
VKEGRVSTSEFSIIYWSDENALNLDGSELNFF